MSDLAKALQDFSSTVDFIRKTNQQIYDVYVNPTPKDVTIYGPDGQVISSVPNRAKLVAEFEEWKANVRGEYPLVNIHHNTLLQASTDSSLKIPDGYNYNANLIDVAEIIPVPAAVDDPESRHPIAKEFLDWALGNHGNYVYGHTFNILHIITKPKPADARWFMWKGFAAVEKATYRAFVKVTRGTLYITHGGVFQADGQWKLVETRVITNYVLWDEHRLDRTSTGEVLEYYFALPQVLLGFVSLPKDRLAPPQIQLKEV